MTGTAVHRVIVSVGDLGAATELYGGVLGLAESARSDGLARLTTAAGVEVLLHRRPPVPSDTAVAIGFTVDDLLKTVAAWVRHGGSVVDPPAVQPWGEQMAVVRDGDGHLVCLVQAT